MKIHGNDQIPKDFKPETHTKTQPTANEEFGAVLKKTVEDSQKPAPPLQPTTFTPPVSGAQRALSSSPDTRFAVKRIENLLALLDRYSRKLADPGMTLKKIDPIVKEIKQERENLAPTLDGLPDGDELKEILSQTLVTAAVEVTKFYRGDYITP